ncbi:MAG: hypothetical protein NTU44_15235 [Bacteroidetes bacterium]|nr:hypothetical protein [Bacteroidota bacterium]
MILLTASVFFYMYQVPILVCIPGIMILTSWICGRLIERKLNPVRKKILYISGLSVNLGLLIFYKYINFILLSFVQLVAVIGGNEGFGMETGQFSVLNHLIVPLGLSYITFQNLGYLIEIKRGEKPAEQNLGLFATYIMFFPKLLAGPIERAHHFLPQLTANQGFNYECAVDGIKRFMWGLFKKVVVSAHLQPFTDAVFNYPHDQQGLIFWLGAFLFLVQLYADFSGYTDMALGLSQLFGFRLMENFNRPYLSKSTTELWRRWHISLSTWFYEYIFNPIAINRREWNKWAVIYATFITFLLLGWWHGASWNFIIFGFLQALFLSLEFISQKPRKKIRKKIPGNLNSITGIAYVILFMSFSMIFFRANRLNDALYIISSLFSGVQVSFHEMVFHLVIPHYEEGKSGLLIAFAGIVMMISGEYLLANEKKIQQFNKWPVYIRWSVYYLFLILVSWFGDFGNHSFIYFKF